MKGTMPHPHTSGGQCRRSCYHNMSEAVVEGGTWMREDAMPGPDSTYWLGDWGLKG